MNPKRWDGRSELKWHERMPVLSPSWLMDLGAGNMIGRFLAESHEIDMDFSRNMHIT
jgi:hypothetical protein